MAQHRIVSLNSSTPTRITPRGSHGGMDITIQNINTTGYIYVGGDETLSTTSYGYRISPNHAISFELPTKDALFLIASDTLSAAIIQTGLESQN